MHSPRSSFLWLLASTSLLSGCLNPTKLDHQQCASIHWYEQGVEYARAGRKEAALDKIAQECRQVGASVDKAAYKRGYRSVKLENCQSTAKAFQLGSRGKEISKHCTKEETPAFYEAWDNGLRTYCVPEFGFELGRSGGRYNDICPPELQPAFKAAYDRGYLVFEQVQDLRQQTKGLRTRLAEMDRALTRNQTHVNTLRQRQPGDPEIARLEQERLMLQNQRNMLESQLWDMQGKITHSEVEK